MGRVTLSGVPVHPALVHFPVVFWKLVPLLDLRTGCSAGLNLMININEIRQPRLTGTSRASPTECT